MNKKLLSAFTVALAMALLPLAACAEAAAPQPGEGIRVDFEEPEAPPNPGERISFSFLNPDAEDEAAAEHTAETSAADEGPQADETAQAAAEERVLVVYFSRTNNTGELAALIHEQTGGDLLRLEPVVPYPEDYDAALQVARQEQDTGARPALQNPPESLDAYDVVYLGYPIWYGDAPQLVSTFLESYDFTGKTIVPFCTHGGSGLSGSVQTIRTLAPQATVLEGIAVRGDGVAAARDNVIALVNAAGQAA